MPDWFADVLEFHRKFCPEQIGTTPAPPDPHTVALRQRLTGEEYDELVEATIDEDLPAIADACGDLIYVVIGCAISYGIDLRPVWDAIQAANMAKYGGSVRADGKIGKPPGWQPPDIEGILRTQPPLTANGGFDVSRDS